MISAVARTRADLTGLAAGLVAIAAISLAFVSWLHVSNAATVSTTFLLVVVVVAATSRLWVAIAVSVAAVFSFNFFFLPPVGALTIADPQNWIALFAFVAVSLVASQLSAATRARTDEAIERRDELARLFDLSRDVLQMTETREALATLARAVGRRFDLNVVAIALPRGTGWDVVEPAPSSISWNDAELTAAFAHAQSSLEFDARARTYGGHRTMTTGSGVIRLVPLRSGTRPIGLLAASGRPIEAGTLDALGGVVALAIERAQLLDERKAGELARQGEQLKTALLASLAHDLRTPLTAIRVAASNIKGGWLADGDRAEQTDLILSEVERLTRLFQNILEMARIDAGAVAADARWVHPAEIVAAAREQVEHALTGHPVALDVTPDTPVRLDPRLTASALAHLLENAAQYSPADAPIHITSRIEGDGLAIAVRDHGPGIPPADLTHVFDRFYRGAAAQSRTSGTGMGLAIARGLLAAERGRIWAENCSDGGALFTIFVPALLKDTAPASPAHS
jgi:two-component system, OmpR family, sensor histidine kinase KdpD